MRPVVPIIIAVALGCGGDRGDGAEKVLARVDGEVISETDLAFAAVSALGPKFAGTLGPDDRRKLLESLVLGRVISKTAERELGPKERADLERRVHAYRQQLLVEHYVGTQAKLTEITPEAIGAYYDAHPERFGGGAVRRYELLVSAREPTEAERQKLLAALREASKRKDWAAWSKELARQGFAMAHRQGEGGEGALHSRLASLIAGLSPGQTSGLTYIDGKPYLARVIEEVKRPPRPLEDVRDEIRTALMAKSKSEALSQIASNLSTKARVQYTDAAPPVSSGKR
jgi:hypothetical protein